MPKERLRFCILCAIFRLTSWHFYGDSELRTGERIFYAAFRSKSCCKESRCNLIYNSILIKLYYTLTHTNYNRNTAHAIMYIYIMLLNQREKKRELFFWFFSFNNSFLEEKTSWTYFEFRGSFGGKSCVLKEAQTKSGPTLNATRYQFGQLNPICRGLNVICSVISAPQPCHVALLPPLLYPAANRQFRRILRGWRCIYRLHKILLHVRAVGATFSYRPRWCRCGVPEGIFKPNETSERIHKCRSGMRISYVMCRRELTR